jgi:hypothetical protein
MLLASGFATDHYLFQVRLNEGKLFSCSECPFNDFLEGGGPVLSWVYIRSGRTRLRFVCHKGQTP